LISGKFSKRLRFHNQPNKNNASSRLTEPPASSNEESKLEASLDLAVLAQVARGDRIEVEKIANRTLDLFQRTIKIAEERLDDRTTSDGKA